MNKALNTSRSVFTAAVVAALAVTAAACGNENEGAGGENITLMVADSLPDGHTLSEEGIKFWMEEVEAASDGQVQFEHYPNEQLADADALLDATRDGLTDIGYVVPDYVSDVMPLSGVAGLPGYYQDSETGSAAFMQVLQDTLAEEEFMPNGVRPLFGVTLPPYQIMTTNVPVTAIEDWEGLKIRSSGGSQDLTIQEIGAAPVSLPGPEIYTAAERETVDGTMLPISSIGTYTLQEVLSHSTTNASLGGTGVTFSINEQVWSELSPDLQEIMAEASEESVAHLSAALDAEVDDVIAEFGDTMTMTELPDETVQRWNDELSAVGDRWVDERESRGLPAEMVLDSWEAAIDE